MKIRDCIRKVKGYIFAQVVLSLVATVSIACIPVCNKCLVDLVLDNAGINFVTLVIIYIFAFFVYLFATWGSERFVWKSAIVFENALKKECYTAILKLKYSDYKKKKSDEYLSILTNNITSIEQDYLQPICALIKSLVSVVAYAIIVSICTSPIICVALIILSVIAAFSPRLYQKKLRCAGKAYVDGAAVYTKKTADLLEGAEMVDAITRTAFGKQNALSTDLLSNQRYNLGKAKVNGNTISGAAICLIDTIVFILCGILMLNGEITVGVIVAAVTYAQAFTEPVQEILYDINTLNASKDIVQNLEEMLNVFDKDIDSVGLQKKERKHDDVILKNVCVNFPEKKLCYNVKFSIGKKYLITGKSGKGKTTLLNTIVEKGIIEDYFYLSQHQHIFSEDAFNNISIFGAYPDFKTIESMKLPMYNRIRKAKDCSVLSGGEKQILKLCRMIVQNKGILVLDEPFAALDNNNTKEIFHILSMMPETIILVSHITEFEESDLKNWQRMKIEDICYEEKL